MGVFFFEVLIKYTDIGGGDPLPKSLKNRIVLQEGAKGAGQSEVFYKTHCTAAI